MAPPSPKDDRAYVYDMLESSRQAASYLAGLTLAQFLADSKTQDAVVLRLAMIDDLAQELSHRTRAKLMAEPIRLARTIRHRIAGADGRVDFPAAWQIAGTELTPLIAELEQYLLAAG